MCTTKKKTIKKTAKEQIWSQCLWQNMNNQMMGNEICSLEEKKSMNKQFASTLQSAEERLETKAFSGPSIKRLLRCSSYDGLKLAMMCGGTSGEGSDGNLSLCSKCRGGQ